MNISIKQKNVYAEAFVILKHLEDDAYNKIPKEVMLAIEENRNLEYNYEMNEDLDLEKQPMMQETKAVLFNIYKDYIATPEEKAIIEKDLQRQREEINQLKKEKYNPDDIFKDQRKKPNVCNQAEQLSVVKNDNIIKRIINKIRQLLTKKS